MQAPSGHSSNLIRKTLASIVVLASLSVLGFIRETWDFSASIRSPAVIDNMASRGYRAYRTENLRGKMVMEIDEGHEPRVEFTCLTNRTFKVSGANVSYDCLVSDPRFHFIGSNKTGKFTRASVSFSLEAFPKYLPAVEPDSDNTLVLSFSGIGTARNLSGRVTGTLGCGCSEYGHVSPTRLWDGITVTDVASVYGNWRMKRTKREEIHVEKVQ